MTTITEAEVEQVALDWLSGLGWAVAHGPDIAPDTPSAERTDYGQVVLARRLRDAVATLNPALPASALDDAYRKLTRPEGSTLEARNRAFHRILVNGVEIEYRDSAGRVRGDQVRVIDFDNPANNDWLAVNQFTVTENQNTRRPDVVLFVNGLPLGIIELKNPADEDATIWTAWQQLQTYKAELPTLFSMNEALVVSDGTAARIGTLTAGKELVQALADRHRRGAGRFHYDRATGDAGGRVRTGPLSGVSTRLHRFRGRRQRRPRQEDGGLSPVPRCPRGCGRDPAGCDAATRRGAGSRGTGTLRSRAQAGWGPRGPPHRSSLAHPGVGKEPDDGFPTLGLLSVKGRWRTRPL